MRLDAIEDGVVRLTGDHYCAAVAVSGVDVDLLAPTEQEALVVDRRPSAGERRASARNSNADQLALFAPAGPHPAVLTLRAVDVNSMTPLQALTLIAELSRQARDG